MRPLHATDDLRAVLAEPAHAGLRLVEPGELARILGAARGLGFQIVDLDLGRVDKAAVLAQLALELAFPATFGHNWDALADALGDLSWWRAPGLVLVLEHPVAWRTHDPEAFEVLLDVLEEAADGHAARGLACWVLVAEHPRIAPTELATSGDVYAYLARLGPRALAGGRALEAYLAALWQLAHAQRDAPTLPVSVFAQLLADALVAPVPAYDPRWAERAAEARRTGFVGWEDAILAKIVDLHELGANGKLADDQRYFGLDAPRGGRWYNFDPATFLECGAAGTFEADEEAELDAISWDRFAAFLGAGQSYE